MIVVRTKVSKKSEKERAEFQAFIEESNKSIAEEYKREPMYLLRGLRRDGHYGVRLQDEIETEVLYDEDELQEQLTNKDMQWKEVQVYNLSTCTRTTYDETQIKALTKTPNND